MIKATHQPYELYAFAKKHAISADDARDILTRHGLDREASDAAASGLSALVDLVPAKI